MTTDRDRIYAIVAEAWRATLPNAPFDPAVRWIDAGADSLKSLHLVMRLEEALDRKVPFDLIRREMTVDELTDVLAADPSAPTASALPPIFLVPGVFGDGPILAEFRRSFGGALAFELVDLPDLGEPLALHGDMVATGRFVADQIAARAGDQPIVIAGFSFGGSVGYEAARHLQSIGRDVALLILLDSFPDPMPDGETIAERVEPVMVDQPAAKRPKGLLARGGPRPGESWIAYFHRLTFMALAASGATDLARRHLIATRAHIDRNQLIGRRKIVLGIGRRRAIARWRPRPLDLPCLLAVSDQGAAAGTPDSWAVLCPKLRIVRLPGVHLDLFEAPSLALLTPSVVAAVEDAVAGNSW